MSFVPIESRTAELEIKKSLFLASAVPVTSEEEAKERIRTVRDEHPKATHVVWAYIIGEENSQRLGMSDDGEPHGTAGKPALSTLQYSNLTNIVVTIVRYFGGTKLGTGGLVKAYTDAVKAVIDPMDRKKLVDESSFRITAAYTYYDGIKKAVGAESARIEREEFDTAVRLELSVESCRSSSLCEALTELTNGSIIIEEL